MPPRSRPPPSAAFFNLRAGSPDPPPRVRELTSNAQRHGSARHLIKSIANWLPAESGKAGNYPSVANGERPHHLYAAAIFFLLRMIGVIRLTNGRMICISLRSAPITRPSEAFPPVITAVRAAPTYRSRGALRYPISGRWADRSQVQLLHVALSSIPALFKRPAARSSGVNRAWATSVPALAPAPARQPEDGEDARGAKLPIMKRKPSDAPRATSVMF